MHLKKEIKIQSQNNLPLASECSAPLNTLKINPKTDLIARGSKR